MEKIKVTAKTEKINSSRILTAEGFGGWMARNLGSDGVTINGIYLRPYLNEGIPDEIDFTNLDSNVVWNDDIKIVFNNTISTDKDLLLVRLKYEF